MKSILLFGGTFDPVHNGHTAMATVAMAETGASQLIILPAGNPYQRGRPPIATARHRSAMLAIAFGGSAGVSIDARELERAGPTYTIDTLRQLRGIHGEDAALIWLIGGDAFAGLDSWRQWRSLFAFANFAVVPRRDEPRPPQIASAALMNHLVNRQTAAIALGRSACGNYAVLAASVPPVSSTGLRARLRDHRSIRGLAPDAVCDYIEQHKLYVHEERN